MKSVSINLNNRFSQLNVEYPNVCPHCGRTMSPELVSQSDGDGSTIYDYESGVRFALTYRCSYNDCKKYFAIEYIYQQGETKSIEYAYRPPIEVSFPENIKSLSKMFVAIYSQSAIAESERLDLIAGVGYRKATEFLIKDYAIKKSLENQNKIERQPLIQVIKDCFDGFPKLQNLATAVAWIGNDETHYVRRHDDKDLNDLKRFISSAVHFISADLDAEEALSLTSSN